MPLNIGDDLWHSYLLYIHYSILFDSEENEVLYDLECGVFSFDGMQCFCINVTCAENRFE